jgi:hypothetical protein
MTGLHVLSHSYMLQTCGIHAMYAAHAWRTQAYCVHQAACCNQAAIIAAPAHY